MLRLAPALAIGILLGPVVFGMLATLLPAFGYLPSLGEMGFTSDHFGAVWQAPGMQNLYCYRWRAGWSRQL